MEYTGSRVSPSPKGSQSKSTFYFDVILSSVLDKDSVISGVVNNMQI